MANLGSLCEKYATLVESKSGSDSNAPQLELLHEIFELLKTAPPDDIKAATPTLEKGLTASILQGPAAPVRRLISSCLCYAYARGARQTMYTTVGQLLSWLNNAKTPASSVLSKVATAAVLGELCEMHGGAMVSLCQDVINLMIKNLRTVTELPYRQISATALAAALAGSGGVNKEVQQEALKSIKGAFEERRAPLELRVACLQARCRPRANPLLPSARQPLSRSPSLSLSRLPAPHTLAHPLTPGSTLGPRAAQCLPSLARYSEQFWQGDLLDQISSLLFKALDDPSPPLRAAAATALGETCVAALDAPWKLARRDSSGGAPPGKPAPPPEKKGMFKFGGSKLSGMLEGAQSSGVGPKKSDAASAIEAVVATLAAPFTRNGATRELRAGIARATVRMLRSMKRPSLEKSSTWLLQQLLSLLGAPGGGRQLTECVTHMVRTALLPRPRPRPRPHPRPRPRPHLHLHPHMHATLPPRKPMPSRRFVAGARWAGRDAVGAWPAGDGDFTRDGGDRQGVGGGDGSGGAQGGGDAPCAAQRGGGRAAGHPHRRRTAALGAAAAPGAAGAPRGLPLPVGAVARLPGKARAAARGVAPQDDRRACQERRGRQAGRGGARRAAGDHPPSPLPPHPPPPPHAHAQPHSRRGSLSPFPINLPPSFPTP